MSETPTRPSWLEAVQQIVNAVRRSDVTELAVGNGAFSVRVKREPSLTVTLVGSAPRPTEGEGAADDERLHRVLAPFTGVFYRSPTPSAGAYVDQGEWVDVDAVIGLVETMKIFNEIRVDVAGRIVRYTAENGQLVHTGDPLAILEPGERAAAEPEAAV